MTLIPNKLFLTKGVGKHKDKLQSFELALRNAGIQHCNLVNVSSIIPPNCEIIPTEKGKNLLKPGQIAFVVLAQNSTNEPNRLISASIGLALPKDRSFYGYLSEYHSYGESAKKAGDYAEDLAATMLATTLGIEFDADKAWDEKKQVFRMSGKIIRTSSITQTARGDLNGLWTTVVACAVFIID
ncbi:MAG TPA: arginine decarboxylase, pyruvoyl-dependent [Thermoplasmatales archaeon]|nr:arginine decarboxylase, pyruvoyl-dependent [Thermoplasmatales archaeon]